MADQTPVAVPGGSSTSDRGSAEPAIGSVNSSMPADEAPPELVTRSMGPSSSSAEDDGQLSLIIEPSDSQALIKQRLPASATIAQLKQSALIEWPGKPKADGIKLFWRGRLLSDSETLEQVFIQGDEAQRKTIHYILAYVKPAAYTETLPTPVARSEHARASSDVPAVDPPATTPAAPAMARAPEATATTSPMAALAAGLTGPASLGAPYLTSADSSASQLQQPRMFGLFMQQLTLREQAQLLEMLSNAKNYYAQQVKTGLADAESDRTASRCDHERDEALERSVSALFDGTGLQLFIDKDISFLESVIAIGMATSVTELERGARAASSNAGYEVVHIGGMPFLLQLPPDYNNERPSSQGHAAASRLARDHVYRGYLDHMIGMIKLSAASRTATPITYSRGLHASVGANARFNGQGGPVNMADVAARPPMPPMGQPRLERQNARIINVDAGIGRAGQNGAGVAVIINLDELGRTLVPLFFLTLKISVLLYIFGRHASVAKRVVMGLLAVAWIIWEGLSIRRRRRTEEARARARRLNNAVRDLQRGVNARAAPGAAPNGAAVPQNDANDQGAPPPAEPREVQVNPAAGRAADDARALRRIARAANDPHRQHRSHRRSPLRPKYWIHLAASVGLGQESREIGIVQGSTSMTALAQLRPPPPPANSTEAKQRSLARFLLSLKIFFVLFVSTLSPEVEARRRKLLDRRDRLVSQIRAAEDARRIAAEIAARNAANPTESSRSEPESANTPVSTSQTSAQEIGTRTPELGAPARDEPLPALDRAEPLAEDGIDSADVSTEEDENEPEEPNAAAQDEMMVL
ncbi:uncharacterized protein L969DRAFT_53707 [Mixia osmundae IAM 14324]|uniref:Ubiquitin-like domain-containing protein n=1 Tax=Mixia osmundae (strain CBS 9802 / IAM 14324 / JCM 22182 / KY 12970) TaxID=764103 RepID=G7EAX4_MIXOS|nr:uncharacterized protein L969DRAFT_53707 [Mixia osmundae IAM 14324]KEI37019.1 hypothetical protein L969DRAFT_53707 [Mixia osmundae IAM 14324]GAA99984.1 hypothetical protein E5Q_06687 [Mixia osmundae IAM 14324]